MNFEIDNYKFFIYFNVLKYTISSDHDIKIEYEKKQGNENPEIYLILDSYLHHSFSHWIFDSVIYLPLFNKLKKIFPNIKIVLHEERKYKLIFLEYFHIEKDLILYQLNTSNNICIYPQFHTNALNMNSNSPDFYFYYNKLFDYFNVPNNKKTISLLLLPHHKIENKQLIQHNVDTSDIEKNIMLCPLNTTVDTSKLNSLQEQINLISQSRVIIVPDDLSLVNGIFAKNSIIISLGLTTYYQSFSDSLKIKHIIKKISQNNIFIYVPYSKNKYDKMQIYTYDMIEDLTNSNDVTKLCEKLDHNIYLFNKKKITDIPILNFDD
jgi:hypothetical protein